MYDLQKPRQTFCMRDVCAFKRAIRYFVPKGLFKQKVYLDEYNP